MLGPPRLPEIPIVEVQYVENNASSSFRQLAERIQVAKRGPISLFATSDQAS